MSHHSHNNGHPPSHGHGHVHHVPTAPSVRPNNVNGHNYHHKDIIQQEAMRAQMKEKAKPKPTQQPLMGSGNIGTAIATVTFSESAERKEKEKDKDREEKSNNNKSSSSSSSSSSIPSSSSSSSSTSSRSHAYSSRHRDPDYVDFSSLPIVPEDAKRHSLLRDSEKKIREQNDEVRECVVSVLSCILEQLFSPKPTDVLPEDPSQITMFHTERVPQISISSYLHRLSKYAECSSEVLIQSIIHINRILHHRPTFSINSLNIHRLLLTSLLCSAKFFDDTYFNNSYYAKVGGVPAKELNGLEVEFLALINFDLFVNYNVYQHFYSELSSPKLHSMCSCKYALMPSLLAEEIYYPSLIPQVEPMWNEEEMIMNHSLQNAISPTVNSPSTSPKNQNTQQVESNNGNGAVNMNTDDDIVSICSSISSSSSSSSVSAHPFTSISSASLPHSHPPHHHATNNKRFSPCSTASTASRPSSSTSLSSVVSDDDDQDVNGHSLDGEDERVSEPRTKLAKKSKSGEFQRKSQNNPNDNGITMDFGIITPMTSDGPSRETRAMSITVPQYAQLVNKTTQAMDTLTIESEREKEREREREKERQRESDTHQVKPTPSSFSSSSFAIHKMIDSPAISHRHLSPQVPKPIHSSSFHNRNHSHSHTSTISALHNSSSSLNSTNSFSFGVSSIAPFSVGSSFADVETRSPTMQYVEV